MNLKKQDWKQEDHLGSYCNCSNQSWWSLSEGNDRRTGVRDIVEEFEDKEKISQTYLVWGWGGGNIQEKHTCVWMVAWKDDITDENKIQKEEQVCWRKWWFQFGNAEFEELGRQVAMHDQLLVDQLFQSLGKLG